MLDALRMELIYEAKNSHEVEYLILGADRLDKSPMLMIALCKTGNVVSMDWLVQSFRSKKVLPCGRYLAHQTRVMITQQDFAMKKTLHNGFQRRKEGGLLAGWQVVFCNGVSAIADVPTMDELKLMVRAAGGTVQDKATVKENARRVVVISSDPPKPSQLSADILRISHAGGGMFTINWLLDCYMNQKLVGVRSRR